MPVFDRATIATALPDHELGPEIGQGAFGVVIAARHRALGRDHAVKVLVDSDGHGEEKFRQEAEAAAGLDHMHVVRTHDYKFRQGLGLIVMERLTGGTLRDRIGTGVTTQAQACVIGLAAAGALHAAHRRRHIHRDVKPTNMMFTDDGCLRVTDFGIAKWMDGGAAVASRTVGSPGYMAPEQFGVGELRPSSDVYALAVVVYELLAGSPPFVAAEPSLPSYMRLHLYADPPRPDNVPEPLVDVLIRALAKHADDRHPSARDFAIDLAAAASRSLPDSWLLDAGMPLFVDEEVREVAQGRTTRRTSGSTTSWAPPTTPLARPHVAAPPAEPAPTERPIQAPAHHERADHKRADHKRADHERAGDAPAARPAGIRETIPGERLVLPVAAVLLLLLVAIVATFGAIQDDYFVGEHNGQIAIFRGADIEIAGIPLHTVQESRSLRVADLPDARQEEVRDGVDTGGLDEARAYVAELTTDSGR